MEHLNSDQSNIKNNNLKFEFDLDNLNFSALDKGLGFHHKEEKLKEKKFSQTYELKNQKLRTTREIKEVNVPTLKTDKTLSVPEISIEEAFLGNANKKLSIELNDSIPKADEDKLVKIESPLEKVTAAWAVDLILIFISIIAALILFSSATGINSNDFMIFLEKKESQVFIVVFFTIFYLLYFSVLDLNSSPGKLLFGTKLIAINNKRLTVFNTFSRAAIILISIPLFLLPLIFGLHNKFSGTQSVEEKW